MDKGFVGNESNSASSAATSNSNSSSTETLLKHVNKTSYKIAKPIRKPLLPPQPASSSSVVPVIDSIPPQSQSQQPPVYNINKNDFRDVVQKLTGSPAHDRFPPPPPPVSQTRPPSSRLQRIRPPPLGQITNRPPLTHMVPRPQNDLGQRGPPSAQPFTPLPPLPSVHTAAESPISAYMRFFQNSAAAGVSSMWSGAAAIGPHSDPLMPQKDVSEQSRPISPLPPAESPITTYMRFFQNSVYPSYAASPRWESGATPPPAQHPPHFQPQPPPPPPIPSSASSSSPFPVFPLSPLPFGCIPSPRSQYGMLSPSLLLSPTGQFGLPQLPLSPTMPVPSPRWKGI